MNERTSYIWTYLCAFAHKNKQSCHQLLYNGQVFLRDFRAESPSFPVGGAALHLGQGCVRFRDYQMVGGGLVLADKRVCQITTWGF